MQGWRRGDIDLELGGVREWAERIGRKHERVELISVLVAVLAIGVAQSGLILTSNRGLRQDIRQDMAQMESRLDKRISGLESQINELRERMTHEVGELRERMARLEGLLEGLREAITGRVKAS